jgi:hypothetical protein
MYGSHPLILGSSTTQEEAYLKTDFPSRLRLRVSLPSLAREYCASSCEVKISSHAFASALANPTDVVKTRMQRPHPAGGRPYRHTLAAFIAVYREGASASPAHALRGGLQSLWRGVDATTYRGLVLSTSQICAYDQAKQSIKRHGLLPEGIGLHVVASSIAGFICTVTSTPIGMYFTSKLRSRLTFCG